ncbi:nuclear transport factor 2 family protein [Balneolaceae bacterium YR4-1]|uniref:Nuclear transport factor 2 family protein n=1 Tax=Halalkalibaculum roseum TaxID=2709311 RepID=A0A6M1SVX3_9BACT|nr:nuclear transport factor 2 family protein [Halalkalibaculum roseum]NGP75124.1 nuclear transport factor 2 family protein [Halalkalibaculum roseum]
MKSFIFACLILLVLVSNHTKSNNEINFEAEEIKVEETLKSFFNCISNYDYNGIREVTSDDFILVENGPVWDTDKFISFIKRFEGDASLSYEFSDMQTTVRGPTAWMVYKNNGTMLQGSQERHFEWTESAVFTKERDQWKIELLHSTMNEPDSTQS